jgi:hypothetical protein
MTTVPDIVAVLREAGLGGRVVHVPQPSQLESLIGLERVRHLQAQGYGGQHLYVPRQPLDATDAVASIMTALQQAGLSGQKVYVPQRLSPHDQTPALQTTLRQFAHTRKKVYIPAQQLTQTEHLVQTLLDTVETIYERTGSALVTAHPHRPGWAFVQALGATRLARQLQVPREAIVDARRRAYQRWRYWVRRYEQPLWQDLQACTSLDRWGAQFLHYLTCRTALRRGTYDTDTDPLLPFAHRSLESRSWKHHHHLPTR